MFGSNENTCQAKIVRQFHVKRCSAGNETQARPNGSTGWPAAATDPRISRRIPTFSALDPHRSSRTISCAVLYPQFDHKCFVNHKREKGRKIINKIGTAAHFYATSLRPARSAISSFRFTADSPSYIFRLSRYPFKDFISHHEFTEIILGKFNNIESLCFYASWFRSTDWGRKYFLAKRKFPASSLSP